MMHNLSVPRDTFDRMSGRAMLAADKRHAYGGGDQDKANGHKFSGPSEKPILSGLFCRLAMVNKR
jgi:hypothetical protein